MSRGSKDERLTHLLRSNSLLHHPKSKIGYDLDSVPHVYLEGIDKSSARPLVFKFHKFKCCVCGHKLREDEEIRDMIGNWHHPGPCDCIEHSELRCDTRTGRACHAHRTSGFQRKAGAAKDFDALYKPGENE